MPFIPNFKGFQVNKKNSQIFLSSPYLSLQKIKIIILNQLPLKFRRHVKYNSPNRKETELCEVISKHMLTLEQYEQKCVKTDLGLLKSPFIRCE